MYLSFDSNDPVAVLEASTVAPGLADLQIGKDDGALSADERLAAGAGVCCPTFASSYRPDFDAETCSGRTWVGAEWSSDPGPRFNSRDRVGTPTGDYSGLTGT